MRKRTYKPGEKVPNGGVYTEKNDKGKKTGRKVHVKENTPFPPTQDNGYKYEK